MQFPLCNLLVVTLLLALIQTVEMLDTEDDSEDVRKGRQSG